MKFKESSTLAPSDVLLPDEETPFFGLQNETLHSNLITIVRISL